MKLSEAELAQKALSALEELANSESIEAIVYLCRKNINRDNYLQKLYEMLTIADENPNAKLHIAKAIYELTGEKIKELDAKYLRQGNFEYKKKR